MEILCHRGHWTSPEEKNTEAAFRKAFENGHGVETDVRDNRGQLVVSHDVPSSSSMTWDYFLQIYKSYPQAGTLAINIKSDSLQLLLKESLEKHSVEKYFVFDMSIPDTLGYFKGGFRVFSRVSEYESLESPLINLSQGVWLDIFLTNWADESVVKTLIAQKKKVAVVSPELHRRSDYLEYWSRFKALRESNSLLLCTDFPEDAVRFFEVKNEKGKS